MDNGQGHEEEEKDRKKGAEMKMDAPPPGIEDGGGGDYSSSGRKRARRQEGEAHVLKTAGDEGVKVSVQGKAMAKVKPGAGRGNERGESSKAQLKVEGEEEGEASSSSIIGGGGKATRSGNKTGKRTLVQQGKAQVKVGGVKRGEVPSPSLPTGGNDAAQASGMEGLEEEAHPCLFIENILDVVFSHIISQPGPREDVAKDVQNIRLVCKTWKESVTRGYRRERALATIAEYDQRTKSLAEFMKTMKKCSDMIPAQKFKFWMCAFQSDNLELFLDFFRLYGPEAVSLEINISHGEADRLMMSLKNLPDLQMTKLKTLIIKPIRYPVSLFGSKEVNGRGFASLIQFLLTAATTLQEFELSYYPPPSGHSYCQWQVVAMQLAGQAIVRSVPGTIRTLKLFIADQVLDILAEAGLKLERFELGVPSTWRWKRRTMYRFLASQAPTLKALKIWNPPWKPSSWNWNGRDLIHVEFPPLGELVELELSDAVVTTSAPFDFATSFPKLHRLELPKMSKETAFRALLSTATKPSHSLKILHLPVWQSASLAPLVKNVAQSFPSITELHLVLNKGTRETMEEIFKYFDNLESLHISFFEQIRNANYWVDSIFSGLSEDDCSRIRSRQDFGTVNLNEFQRQPSLLDLISLKKLVVHVLGDGENRWIAFSDFSAHFIFLGMENLREIELANSDVQFSPRYLDLLRDKLFMNDVLHE